MTQRQNQERRPGMNLGGLDNAAIKEMEERSLQGRMELDARDREDRREVAEGMLQIAMSHTPKVLEILNDQMTKQNCTYVEHTGYLELF